ncbi:hypothetical protein VOLCADRAFT_88485 [Volvox carteri f. nagariensis]|uniref:Uncharacterized protein n=1 Tax=Volvox carteri f. nagariensis TaxID=3068 RepID=D8TP45_VOLCA|nr:uncharacterized protein VOLCADRAFT_88485 [Volvox carteri f. nagariensis]EFJ50697.1 hypothetical protein VOLCADRAFT_88485 [Volvox carteri f. nagariensis]|eukprot:XP_002948290.1 hypothetical protein VOLCADRAFT_88485 [Volvox carteri f. nagariensis]
MFAFNGRDKADVLRDTQAEVALKAAQAQAVNASAATASAEGSATSNDDIWADWRRVDSKVNKYPTQRLFTAVGSGGDEFREAMIRCVVEVVGGPVDVDVRPSSGGNYQSVRVGPVTVNNPDQCMDQGTCADRGHVPELSTGRLAECFAVHCVRQVLEIFTKMRQDKRLKFHL